jgi:hypothetical protein
VNKNFPISAFIIVLILISTNSAYATNHNTSVFLDSLRYTDSNTYRDANHTFSIQPPINWVFLNNLPSNISNKAIAIFSNNDKNQLATFGIYHRYIAQNVIDAINNHSDNDVLATISHEMSDKSADSQTIVLNGVIDRYNDGVRVVTSSVTQYTTDNSTSFSENIIYFLNNGNQYTLDLTSNPNNIQKNSQLFEDSARSFLVSQTSSVPEFPFSIFTLIIATFLIIFIHRIKN